MPPEADEYGEGAEVDEEAREEAARWLAELWQELGGVNEEDGMVLAETWRDCERDEGGDEEGLAVQG